MYNLSKQSDYYGTIKYKGLWNTFDQFIVSGTLLTGGSVYSYPKIHILSNKFLLQEDKKYYGYQPFRTYNGRHYEGGYSDHLPVYLDFFSTDAKNFFQ